MVVAVEPGCKRGVAGVVGAVDADVGPFVEQSAVEPFNFAVPLRSPGWKPVMAGAGGFDGGAEGMGLVAGAVVGLDDFDVDAMDGEPAVSSLPEADGGAGLLVGEHLAVGDAAVA